MLKTLEFAPDHERRRLQTRSPQCVSFCRNRRAVQSEATFGRQRRLGNKAYHPNRIAVLELRQRTLGHAAPLRGMERLSMISRNSP